ncbi:hypothetical protein IX27_00215 [Streptomyces sp. JS01]|uniref:DUF6093 family protein n=1 Tax=Streptomyces sp. JS01 TaxID=1525753 RepID=UPI0005084B42|nr:DUF6093 family protein [Streptomyces sp. JS01]KFK91496.1 hypothetical protein IX27_00215 [Streptomyces sp. JS01]
MHGLGAFLARGRQAHQELMGETLRLYRQGEGVFDRDTGGTVPGPQTTLYGPGPGRVKPVAQASGTEEQAGEREIMLRDYEVALPWDAELPPDTRVLAGDRIEVLSSADPRMPGLILWVTAAQYSGTATAWRISAEDRS